MSKRSRHAAAIVLGIFGLLAGGSAQAAASTFCSLFGATFVVGNFPADSACTHNDIQSAISAVVCPKTTIVVTRAHSYSAQHLLIQDTNVTISGSSANSCTDFKNGSPTTPTAPVLKIDGTGHIGDSVVSIRGTSNVTLRYIEITGGDVRGVNNGGGISLIGGGRLTLDTDLIDNNLASSGGGVFVNGLTAATLTLEQHTQIKNNSADVDGGGVWIGGPTRMFMLESDTTIALNHADHGYGGGLEINGPARADVASPGTGAFDAIGFNSADRGGGVAVFGGSLGDGVLRLFSIDATHPVKLSQNHATSFGGAFYTLAYAFVDPPTRGLVCAKDFRVDSNSAATGAAFYANGVATEALSLNPADDCGPESTQSLGGVTCAPGIACNEFYGNVTEPPQGETDSGSILVLASATAAADRFSLRANQAAHMISLLSGGGDAGRLSNCLVADNNSSSDLVVENAGQLQIDNCTFANNSIGAGAVFNATRFLNLTRSIVAQPGVPTIAYSADGCSGPGCVVTQYVLSDNIATFPPGAPGVVQASDPLFVDATNQNTDARNYRLRATVQGNVRIASDAIDAAPAGGDNGFDLDGNPRDQDVAAITDSAGNRDLGAYEAQPIADRLFADAFGDAVSLVFP